MKTIRNNLGFIFLLFIFSCSSSSDDAIINNPPPVDNTPTPQEEVSHTINLIHDKFEGENFVVIGSEGWNFMVAYKTELDGNEMNFEVIDGELPSIMQDDEGSRYNIFGTALSGPNEGKKLTPMNGYIGYWFAWGTFYPGLEIFESNAPLQNAGSSVSGSDGWLIPRDEVFVGALRDAIPAIDDPVIVAPNEDGLIASLNEQELVVVTCIDSEYRAYPHAILNWHEIVNDKYNDNYYSVVYCPLTGTATIWDRFISGEATTFGVSGFLYNSNIVPYDRKTSSNWSQMLQLCVQGDLIESKTNNFLVLETTIETWKQITTTKKILSTNTGYNRDYNRYPYGSYISNTSINFPINFTDNRLHPKERVLGVIVNGKAKAYRFESFK